jgi:1,4-alpha-glucan branching enzyme
LLAKRPFKTKDEVEVSFELDRPGATTVAWVSEHNGWTPIAMRRKGKGPFRLKVRLPKGTPIQFRYLIDGITWDNDEAADAYWDNGQGADNSVVLTH